MRELSWLAVGIGVVVGAALAAANAYVGLKVGMSVNASIPAAVMGMLVMRALSRKDTLLESNIVQSVGSAGQSLAAGMIFTIPALFLLGYDPTMTEMIIWGTIGGLLGVCFMVPLRRVLIVKEHGNLPYPEGLACAEVLQSGNRGGAAAMHVVRGAVAGAGFRLLTGLGFFPEYAASPVTRTIKTQLSLAAEPALLGVGYILGARIAAVMLAGACLAWFVLIPAIAFFGAGGAGAIFPSTTRSIADMSPAELHGQYIKYIGAGAVAVGGLFSLIKTAPTIGLSLTNVLSGLAIAGRRVRDRTDRDLPMWLLLLIVIGLGYAMWRLPHLRVDHIGAVAVLVFGFFFVTVSSRLVGIVGASSNPASGMTIAALLATCLAFRLFVDPSNHDPMMIKIACLSVGAIVCSAICIAGDIASDLKTGFLLRATPWKQQVGELIGVLTSVALIAGVILLLAKNQGFAPSPDHPHPLPAPQANIMRMLVDGVLDGNLPWELIIMGGAIAVILELLSMPCLPFAVGLYLPLSLTSPIMVGGVIRWIIERRGRKQNDDDPGILTSSGLVAGNGLMGIGLVALIALTGWAFGDPRWLNPATGRDEPIGPVHLVPWLWAQFDPAAVYWGLSDTLWHALPILPFAVLSAWLGWSASRRA
jgi:putative OPT family oligopeptide transporter